MKPAVRKKRLDKLLRLSEEVREATLTSYYQFCKERAAKAFIEWRIEQANLVKNPSTAKALRLRRLSIQAMYKKEDVIFRIYLDNEYRFE